MTIRRILVNVESATSGRAALEAAVEIAARLQAELVGLFVEDIDLLHLAGLPFAHEVGFPSAMRRPLDVSAMERSLRSLADHARSALAEIAGRMPLQWSFRVARGPIPAELLAAAAEADLLVARAAGIERAALRIVGGTSTVVLVLQDGETWHAPLVAMCSAAISPARFVPALAGLSQLYGKGIDVLLLCEDAALADEWERELRALLGVEHTEGRIRVVRAADAGELAGLVGGMRPAARGERKRR